MTKKQIKRKDVCKYGHLCGYSQSNKCLKCSDCGKLFSSPKKLGFITQLK